MKTRTSNKLTFVASVFLLAGSQLSLVQAAGDTYTSQGGAEQGRTSQAYVQQQSGGAPMAQQPQNAPAYGAPDYGTPRYYPPYGGNRDYGNRRGYNTPYPGRNSGGPSFSGPWDSGRGGRGGSSMPWDSGRGGRSMPWDSGRGGRGGWMDKDRFADNWDDMLNAPSDMGEMPGGWNAPSISTPNPVDVGDEFGDASRDVPDQMRNVYDDNRRYNSYDRYGR